MIRVLPRVVLYCCVLYCSVNEKTPEEIPGFLRSSIGHGCLIPGPLYVAENCYMFSAKLPDPPGYSNNLVNRLGICKYFTNMASKC